MLLSCCGLMLLSLAVSDLDVAGRWAGSFDVLGFDGGTVELSVYLNLRQHGAEIVGTAGPDGKQQWPLANGRIDGGKLRFEVLPPEGAAVRFDLRVVDGRLQGEARAERQGRLFRARVRVKREMV